jgi:phage gp16-like protein
MNKRTANRLAKINKAQIGLVHVAKAQLGLTEEEYRDALKAYGGVASSKDLDQEQFQAVLKHFGRCGFKQRYQPPNHRREAGATKFPDIARLPRENQGIMYLIGNTLDLLGKSWAYADGIAGRMFGIERLEWCDKDQLQKVMAALVYQQKKTGDRGRRQERQ